MTIKAWAVERQVCLAVEEPCGGAPGLACSPGLEGAAPGSFATREIFVGSSVQIGFDE